MKFYIKAALASVFAALLALGTVLLRRDAKNDVKLEQEGKDHARANEIRRRVTAASELHDVPTDRGFRD